MKQVSEEEKTLDFKKVQSWAMVASQDPRAKKIKGFMILGIQHAELDAALHRWKARLVGGGNDIQTAEGEKVVEVLEQVQDQISFIIKHHSLELLVQVVELVVELVGELVVLTQLVPLVEKES